MENVTVYSAPACVQCRILKNVLDRDKIPYEDVNIEEDLGLLSEMTELGFAGLPIIKFGDDGYYTMSEFMEKLGGEV